MEKIIFVNASLTDGGSERVMTLIANYFAQKNYEVSMILLRDKPHVYKIDKKINCIQFTYSYKNKFMMFFERIKKIRNVIKEIDAKYVVSFMDDISLFTTLACIGMDRKLIVSIRNDPSRTDKKLYRYISKYFTNPRAYKMVFQTNQAKEYYSKDIQKKGVVIGNPINKDIPLPYLGEREHRIVAVGRLVEQKNFSMLIKAFKKYHEKYPEYILEIYGKGPKEKELRLLVEELGLDKYIFFKGFEANILEKIMTAGMYVSSSNFEGISNTMLEALAMGIPAICTNCPIGGASMVIDNYKNGILIPVGDENALYRAMCEVSGNIDLAKRISNESLKIRDAFSIDKIGSEWEEIFNN